MHQCQQPQGELRGITTCCKKILMLSWMRNLQREFRALYRCIPTPQCSCLGLNYPKPGSLVFTQSLKFSRRKALAPQQHTENLGFLHKGMEHFSISRVNFNAGAKC